MGDEIVYQLDRVICQIRFQTILSINSKIGMFQEQIMGEYPICTLDKTVKIANMNVRDFTFLTEDNKWIVTLSMNSLSLTTTSYVSWDDFLERFKYVYETFIRCFKPTKLTRIGLRYINAIRPSKFSSDCTIDSLIVEKYRSFIHSDLGEILNTKTLIETKVDEDTICRSYLGLIRFTDNNELGFLIDNDIISVKPTIKTSEVDDILTRHNKISYDLFINMTTDKIHKGECYNDRLHQ